ncbi:MAG: 3',5'-cyclic-AMP phosphodiesterase [Anaerolineae bacterium]
MAEKLITFVHLSDTHIHADPTFTGEFIDFSSRPTVAALIDHINALPIDIDFVLHTGDIMTDPEKGEDYRIARDILRGIKYPVHFVPGNHDNPEWVQRYLLNLPEQDIRPELDYTFEVNGVQIICLDSHNAMPDAHSGKLEDNQIAWLDELVSAKDDRPLVVGIHHHPVALQAPWLDNIVLTNGAALHNTLLKARHRLRGVFYGHIHENIATTRDGITYYSALSGWFQTRTWHAQAEPTNDPIHNPGFNLVTLTERDTFVRFYRLPMPF